MDKGWMNLQTWTDEYIDGVNKFLDFAFDNVAKAGEIVCPCKKCGNGLWRKRDIVYEHLIIHGFIKYYTTWVYHGESSSSRTSTNENNGTNKEGVQVDGMNEMLADESRGSISDENRTDDQGHSVDMSISDENRSDDQGHSVDMPPRQQSHPSQAEEFTSGSGASSQHGKSNKRTRGPTMALDLWALKPGRRRITVRLDDVGEPVGPEGTTLIRFLSSMAHRPNLLPLTISDWRRMPADRLDECWRHITDRFMFDHPNARKVLMHRLNEMWKEFKHRLKTTIFDVYPPEERAAHRDPRLTEEEFIGLCEYWSTDRAQASSKRNKTNRKRLLMGHTAGTKSISRHKYDMAKANGKEPNRIDLFLKLHKKRNNQPVDQTAADYIKRFEKRISQGLPSANSPSSQVTTSTPDEIFREVMGPERHGRVRCAPPTVTPISYFGRQQSIAEYECRTKSAEEMARSTAARLQTVETELAQMREIVASLSRQFGGSSSGEQASCSHHP